MADTPFSHFPITIIDNFLDNPEYVLAVSKLLEFKEEPNRRYPGLRTDNLADCASHIHHMVCKKLFSLWYKKDMYDLKFSYSVKSFFQKSFTYHEDPDHIVNSGWQHIDPEGIGAGVIYLTPNANQNSGTSFYDLKEIDPQLFEEKNCRYQSLKLEWYRDPKKVLFEEYVKAKEESELLYEKTMEVKNKFNRLVSFGSQLHKENGLHGDGQNPRLTLIFFVDDLGTVETPSMRLLRGI